MESRQEDSNFPLKNSQMWTFMPIFGIRKENVTKWVQRSLGLVQWFLRQSMVFEWILWCLYITEWGVLQNCAFLPCLPLTQVHWHLCEIIGNVMGAYMNKWMQ